MSVLNAQFCLSKCVQKRLNMSKDFCIYRFTSTPAFCIYEKKQNNVQQIKKATTYIVAFLITHTSDAPSSHHTKTQHPYSPQSTPYALFFPITDECMAILFLSILNQARFLRNYV